MGYRRDVEAVVEYAYSGKIVISAVSTVMNCERVVATSCRQSKIVVRNFLKLKLLELH